MGGGSPEDYVRLWEWGRVKFMDYAHGEGGVVVWKVK